MTSARAFLAGLLLLGGLFCFAGIDLPHLKSAHIEHLLVTPAIAQSARCQGMVGKDFSLTHNASGCPIGGTPATATYEIGGLSSTCVSNVCTSSLTLPNAPNSNDVIAAGVCARNSASPTITTVTYNAVTMTEVSGAATSGGMPCDTWWITGVTGTTATIVVTWADPPVRSFAQVYRIVTTTTTPNAGAQNSNSGGTISQSITVPSNGVGIVFGGQQSPSSPSFTNATLDNIATSTNDMLAGRVTGTGSVSVTMNGGTTGSNGISLAAWSP